VRNASAHPWRLVRAREGCQAKLIAHREVLRLRCQGCIAEIRTLLLDVATQGDGGGARSRPRSAAGVDAAKRPPCGGASVPTRQPGFRRPCASCPGKTGSATSVRASRRPPSTPTAGTRDRGRNRSKKKHSRAASGCRRRRQTHTNPFCNPSRRLRHSRRAPRQRSTSATDHTTQFCKRIRRHPGTANPYTPPFRRSGRQRREGALLGWGCSRPFFRRDLLVSAAMASNMLRARSRESPAQSPFSESIVKRWKASPSR
jgi:hypothetical protein